MGKISWHCEGCGKDFSSRPCCPTVKSKTLGPFCPNCQNGGKMKSEIDKFVKSSSKPEVTKK